MTTIELRHDLDRAEIEYELIEHVPIETARDEATVVGADPADVGKTIVAVADGAFARVVVRACDRLDLHKLRALTADNHARLASEEELVAAYPMYELGAVAPWGGPHGDRVLVDRRVAERAAVVVSAGTHRASVRLVVDDLVALTGGEVADLAE